MDWAGGPYDIDFLKTNVGLRTGCLFRNNNTIRERGWGWEMALSQKIQKHAKWKMTLTEFKPTFRLFLKLFSGIFRGFSVQGGGSRRLSNPLSI